MNSPRPTLVSLSMLLAAGILLFLTPERCPPLFFDEGWAMSVARNWVERNHYGQLINGDLAPASMLNIGFPAVAPIALSFRMFGIGIPQGRLPVKLFTLAALFLLYWLSRRLFGSECAAATLFLATCVSTLPILILGKQAFGETPMLFYLLAGFLCLLGSWRRPTLYLCLTIGLWALAMGTKMQLLPFLPLALLLGVFRAIRLGQDKAARLLAISLTGTVLLTGAFWKLQEYLLNDRIMSTPGVYSVTALVPMISARMVAAAGFIFHGIPTAIGTASYFRKMRQDRAANSETETGEDVVRFVLFALIISWLIWYLACSNGWQRYLLPPTFLGSVYFSSFLQRATCGFDIPLTLKRCALLFRRAPRSKSALSLGALLLVTVGVNANVGTVWQSYNWERDDPLEALSAHMKDAVSPDSLVESYDWEVLFKLSGRYHYPPDNVQIALYANPVQEVNYDPLYENPDYLVIGDNSRLWHLYDDVVGRGCFRLIYQNRRYSLYRRVRQSD